MSLAPNLARRLSTLARIVRKERRHLAETDRRLFATAFTPDRARALENNQDEAERVDAFVGRFGRLQDTLEDKLLPALLAALEEPVGAAIDNLDRGERLGFVRSTDTWLATRRLRNQMVQEYVEDPRTLAEALQAGHEFVALLEEAAEKMLKEMGRRGWG